DQLIQQELHRRNDLPSNVLLLMRHTGMRIGECVDLAYDCLHNAGPDRWAIHVPLGVTMGLTSKELAMRMHISPNTVKAFLRLIMIKMEVATGSAIVAKLLDQNTPGIFGMSN